MQTDSRGSRDVTQIQKDMISQDDIYYRTLQLAQE